MRLSKEELLNAAGLRSEQLARAGAVRPDHRQARRPLRRRRARRRQDRRRARPVRARRPRHLRAFRTAAEREVGLFAQVVGPMSRQRGGEAKARAEETMRELAALSVRLHAALVQIGLREALGG